MAEIEWEGDVGPGTTLIVESQPGSNRVSGADTVIRVTSGDGGGDQREKPTKLKQQKLAGGSGASQNSIVIGGRVQNANVIVANNQHIESSGHIIVDRDGKVEVAGQKLTQIEGFDEHRLMGLLESLAKRMIGYSAMKYQMGQMNISVPEPELKIRYEAVMKHGDPSWEDVTK